MRIIKLIFSYSSLLLFANCHVKNSETKNKPEKSVSPTTNCDLNDSSYSNVRFQIFCIYADRKYSFKKDSAHQYLYANSCLKIDSLKSFGDTLKLEVQFIQNDKKIDLKEINPPGFRTITGVLYKKSENKIIEYITDMNFGFYETSQNSRYHNPLQPEILSFVKLHQDSLNLWFKYELKRRKII